MEKLIPDYQQLWDTMVPNPASALPIQFVANHINAFKGRYAAVGNHVCTTAPVPWFFVGLIHLMECGQNFNTHLYNGDPLSARTVHVPVGHPTIGTPPFTWDFSAVCALQYMGYSEPKQWDTPSILSYLELYNGLGYQSHGIYTPYLWSKTNHYTSGKYTEDGKYDPSAISNQIGAAPILHLLLLPS